MKVERFYHSAVMFLLRTRGRRTRYLKKHNILGAMGENCVWVPWLIPLYPKMIKLHNNVHIHKTARLIPHDVLNGFLKRARPDEEFGAYERLGCIEIMDNVYVSMNAVILPDVKIGSNCIITAGSVVSGDIPDNSVVAGNPAKVIGTFDAYVAARKLIKDQSVHFKNQMIPDEVVAEQWERFEKKRQKRAEKAERAVEEKKNNETVVEEKKTVETVQPASSLSVEERVLNLMNKTFKGIDFAEETAIIDDEVLDSMEIIGLLAALDEEFGYKIPMSMVDAEHFNTVHDIAQVIEKMMQGEN